MRRRSTGPQIITRHSVETAVILSYQEYRKILLNQKKLSEFLAIHPWQVLNSISAAIPAHPAAILHNSLATRNVDHFMHTGVTLVNPWQMGE